MGTTTLTILVIEDEPSVQESLGKFLHHHGFATLHAQTVEGGLKTLWHQRVDAVILDLGLPAADGRERSGLGLLGNLRMTSGCETLPVLVLTGKPLTLKDEELVRSYGAHLFYKPQPYSVLVECLKRELGGQTP
jgi:DNA-binding response OmpR family regulator